jgi:hypothetical protein
MIAPTHRRRRPRRFFGSRGVVHPRHRTAASGPRSQRQRESVAIDPALQSERARFAVKIDGELRLACRGEATMRRELGDAARAFLRARAHDRLGFVRLGDYARECLGVSAESLHEAARVATRLDALPIISSAYDRSEISWAQARALCRVAVAANEKEWLAIARRSTVEALERLVARAEHPDGVPADPEGDPNDIDGEPAVRWRFACPARVRPLWRQACELASRAAGQPLAAWQAAEVIAAEASSGRPGGAALGDRVLIESIRLARRTRRHARDDTRPPHADDAVAESPDDPGSATDAAPTTIAPPVATASSCREPPALEPNPSDPFSLAARLVEAVRALRTAEPNIGRLLRVVVDLRIHRFFRYPKLADYVRERLGIKTRKAWVLLKIEKALPRSPAFADAYREGRLSWVRALALLPVLDRENAAAWIVRAETVTVRRLTDEVAWVLAARDAHGARVPLAPPAIDGALPSPVEGLLASPIDGPVAGPTGGSVPASIEGRPPSPVVVTRADERRESSVEARVQIRTHDDARDRHAAEICDAEIRFTGPASVVALLRDVLDAFADPYEPRWRALERVLRHVITHWESMPRHPDPVFARDGWRCTVPACSSRRNLHDHHVRFRSRGGDNRRDNRTTVCAAHHLHGIHAGTIHASGTAPDAIEWQLGVRPGRPPYLSFIGDRYWSPSPHAGN